MLRVLIALAFVLSAAPSFAETAANSCTGLMALEPINGVTTVDTVTVDFTATQANRGTVTLTDSDTQQTYTGSMGARSIGQPWAIELYGKTKSGFDVDLLGDLSFAIQGVPVRVDRVFLKLKLNSARTATAVLQCKNSF